VLGLVILYLRRGLPESPRWLMIHGKSLEEVAPPLSSEQRL
jgi:hypothetical protein